MQLEPGADGVSCLAAATSQQCLGSMLQSTGSSARRQLDAALRRVHMLQGCQKDAARLQRSAAASRAAASAVMKRAAERCCAAQQKLAFAAWRHCSSRTKLTGRVRAAKQEAHDAATWFCTMQQRMAIYVTGRVAHARKQALAEALSRWRLRAFKRVRAVLTRRRHAVLFSVRLPAPHVSEHSRWVALTACARVNVTLQPLRMLGLWPPLLAAQDRPACQSVALVVQSSLNHQGDANIAMCRGPRGGRGLP